MGLFDIKKPFHEDKTGVLEKAQYLEEDYNMTKKQAKEVVHIANTN